MVKLFIVNFTSKVSITVVTFTETNSLFLLYVTCPPLAQRHLESIKDFLLIMLVHFVQFLFRDHRISV